MDRIGLNNVRVGSVHRDVQKQQTSCSDRSQRQPLLYWPDQGNCAHWHPATFGAKLQLPRRDRMRPDKGDFPVPPYGGYRRHRLLNRTGCGHRFQNGRGICSVSGSAQDVEPAIDTLGPKIFPAKQFPPPSPRPAFAAVPVPPLPTMTGGFDLPSARKCTDKPFHTFLGAKRGSRPTTGPGHWRSASDRGVAKRTQSMPFECIERSFAAARHRERCAATCAEGTTIPHS